jgi:hypothetical protein
LLSLGQRPSRPDLTAVHHGESALGAGTQRGKGILQDDDEIPNSGVGGKVYYDLRSPDQAG